MKKAKTKKRPKHYDTKLTINGTFEDVINVAVRSIEIKPAKAKKKAKKNSLLSPCKSLISSCI